MQMNIDSRRPIAFVLMKFSSNSWNDRTYQAICEVVEEAGYNPLRSDEISNSGPVVEEVCQYIQDSPLLVIDTSGDSHSVSYELGYTHGIKRSFDSTIVLRSQKDEKIPFNFCHYRLLMYKDLGHLKRLLRQRLSLSIPVSEDQLGFALNFSIMPNAGCYGGTVAEAILETLGKSKYTGRCEYYAGNFHVSDYIVALALKSNKGRTPTYEWWQHFIEKVSKEMQGQEAKVVLNTIDCEMGEVGGIRSSFLSRGVIELLKGTPVKILRDNGEDDSWFLIECRKRMESITANNNADDFNNNHLQNIS